MKFRRLVLPDGVWRYRVRSHFDRDDFKTVHRVLLITPAGRSHEVASEGVTRMLSRIGWQDAVTPAVCTSRRT